MTEIKFNENGQGFYDFDFLLNLTNQEFVEKVKEEYDRALRYVNQSFVTYKFPVVRVTDTNDTTTVLFAYGASFVRLKFYKIATMITEDHIGFTDIQFAISMFEEMGDRFDKK